MPVIATVSSQSCLAVSNTGNNKHSTSSIASFIATITAHVYPQENKIEKKE